MLYRDIVNTKDKHKIILKQDFDNNPNILKLYTLIELVL